MFGKIAVTFLAAFAVLVLLYSRKVSATADINTLWTDNIMSWLDNLTQDSRKNEAKYRPYIERAERQYNLRPGILSRLLYQESHYRTDIITGEYISKAGAIGIAQFLPSTAREMNVDPYDPIQSIDGAARYLRKLYGMFGDWKLAVMAYNWGPGNVSAWLRTGRGAKGQAMPAETLTYYTSISSDVGIA